MKKTTYFLLLLLVMAGLKAQTYTFDDNHYRLGFEAAHFGISNVDGHFKILEATLKSKGQDFSDAAVTMKADAASIDTDNEKRDKDLRSSGWFDVEKFPFITFKSTSFTKTGENTYTMKGDLTMHGVTKPVVFNVKYNGKAMNPMMKKNMVGFTVTGRVNRSDFAIGTDAFAAVVGKDIEIKSNVEFFVDDEGTQSK